MTRKEYAEHVGLSEQEAQKYLDFLPILTWVLILVGAAIKLSMYILPLDFLQNILAITAFVCFDVLLVYWVIYCIKILRKTTRSGFNMFFGFLFFPIGLLWFYPYLVRPLKIVVGKIEPPEELPTSSDSKASNKRVWRSVFKTMGLAVLITAVLMTVMVIVIMIQSGEL